MAKSTYREARIALNSPLEVQLNDCLQRNSDHITTIELVENGVSVSTRWETKFLPLNESLYVWRAVRS